MPTSLRREFGSTFTSPIEPTVTLARDASSVSSHWPTRNFASWRTVRSPTRGAPATLATDQAGPNACGGIARSAKIERNTTDAAIPSGTNQRRARVLLLVPRIASLATVTQELVDLPSPYRRNLHRDDWRVYE